MYQKKSADDQPQSIGEISNQLTMVIDQVKNFGEDVKKKMEAGETVSLELKQRTDESLNQMNELKERLTELEQKGARRPNDAPAQRKSLGELVVESEEFKGMDSSARKSIRVKLEQKDIMNVPATTGTGASPTNSLVVSDRVQGIIAPPERTLTIRNLLIPGTTASNGIEFVQETGFTNNAAAVAEGALKPKSDIRFDLKSAPVRTIA
ncbi:phage major capsid protein, partial [Klebsiella pneumoniae]